jgi:hypothetical protein
MTAEPRTVTDLASCFFYHTMDVPGYGTVHGEWDLRGQFDEYIGGVELAGKTMLDIGTASGFLTWEAERRGATVVSFDMDGVQRLTLLPFRDSLYFQDRDRYIVEDSPRYERWLKRLLARAQGVSVAG